jgi:hypothetical protein
MSQATNTAPNKPAMIASIISQIAAPTLETNLDVAAAIMPIITIAIPQKKEPKAYSGKKIKKNIPKMAPIPKIMRSTLPMSARIKPIFANVLEIMFASCVGLLGYYASRYPST